MRRLVIGCLAVGCLDLAVNHNLILLSNDVICKPSNAIPSNDGVNDGNVMKVHHLTEPWAGSGWAHDGNGA